jgi:hypothetical protein
MTLDTKTEEIVPARVAKKNRKNKKVRSNHGAKYAGFAVSSLIYERKTLGQTLASIKKDIPYLLPDFGKGTQYIEIRLQLTPVTITTVAATLYNTVISINAAAFNNFSDFAGIFDEYRMIGGEIAYQPTTMLVPAAWTAFGFISAAIDYGVNTAFGSLNAVLSHDTKKLFSLTAFSGFKVTTTKGIASWPIQLEKLPDKEWIPVTVSNTNVAFWKPFMAAADSPGSGNTGFVFGYLDFQFRGLAA